MNESQPIPSASREHRFRLICFVALICLIFGVVWLGIVLMFSKSDLAGAAQQAEQQAAELQAIIRQQPQFADVRVTAYTNGMIAPLVFAPDELSPEAKTKLERLVAERAHDHATPVLYLVPLPDAPASTISK